MYVGYFKKKKKVNSELAVWLSPSIRKKNIAVSIEIPCGPPLGPIPFPLPSQDHHCPECCVYHPLFASVLHKAQRLWKLWMLLCIKSVESSKFYFYYYTAHF